MPSIAEALKKGNSKLTELIIAHNEIGGEGAQAIAGALKSRNSQLNSRMK